MNIESLPGKVVQKLKRLLLTLKHRFFCIFTKPHQKDSFLRLRYNFSTIYNKLEMHNISNFVTPQWKDHNEELKKIFLPQPPFDFLRNKTIRGTMFVDAGGRWLAKEIAFLEKILEGKALKQLLEEDYVGRPIICNSKYLTSHNSIHHLYHLINFQNKTGVKINKYNSIVEWGGGYGNMAKIVKRMNMEITYTIIDTPLFSCIQWLYLSTILGPDEINIITEPEISIIQRKVNILPLGLLMGVKIAADIFIATWSLSESSKFAQDYVDSVDYFNADHFLIAFQKSNQLFPNASRIGDIVMKRGAMFEAIDFLPGNYYAFS